MACRCEERPRQGSTFSTLPSKGASALFSAACSVLGGLGASSCCVVQLAFNALGLGCAGFAVLTPYEPIFKGITLAALAHLLLREGVTRRAVLTTALSLGLMFSQDAVRFYNSGGLAPLGGLLHPRRSQPDPKQPAVARSQPYEDMLDTLRQGDQGVAGQGQPGSPGAAGSPPPAPTPAAVASRPAAEQRTCQAGTCRDTSVVDSTNSHVAEQQEGDEYEYDDEGDELETANAEAKAGDAGATGEAAAPPADGDLYLRLRVEGIKCEGCAARLRAAVLALPGVRRCVVDFASKAVLLWGEAGQLGEQGAAVRAAIQHMDLSYRVALEESRRF